MVVGYSNREAAHAMTARADPLRLPPHRLRQRPERRTTSAPATAPRAISPPCTRPGSSAPPIHVVHDEAAIRPETGAKAIARPSASSADIDARVLHQRRLRRRRHPRLPRDGASTCRAQIGIAGFHDLEIGRVVSPTLTTVHVPAMEMGRKAGQMILARLAGKQRRRSAAGPRLHHHLARKHAAAGRRHASAETRPP